MDLETYESKKLFVVEWINPKWGEFNYMVFCNKEEAQLFLNSLNENMEDKTINNLTINKFKK